VSSDRLAGWERGISASADRVAITLMEPSSSIALDTTPDAFPHLYQVMESVPNKNSPVVLLDDVDFLPIMHYAPAHIAARLVYLVTSDSDFLGWGYMRLQQCCVVPGRFERLADFLSTHDTFVVRCTPRRFYRLNDFLHSGSDVKMERVSQDSFLISVTFKGHRVESSATPLH
jgi:hypothetical protein